MMYLSSYVPGTWQTYVPWDINLFYTAIADLRGKIGVGFNIGFWIFIIVAGIYLVTNIVDNLTK